MRGNRAHSNFSGLHYLLPCINNKSICSSNSKIVYDVQQSRAIENVPKWNSGKKDIDSVLGSLKSNHHEQQQIMKVT